MRVLIEFMPYMAVDGAGKMFNKKELDEWVKYNTLNKIP